jgi:aminoglycoside/choline kinase family phosphotransferase
MSRDRLIATFLAHHGYAGASPAPLAQDASFRRYLRLIGGPRAAVLMDAPPPEDVRPFLRLAAHLASVGLSAPEIIAADPTNGLVLEEDLGDFLFTSPGSSPLLLDPVIDVLVAIQRAAPLPDLPAWDPTAMAQATLGTLLDWWWPAAFDAPAPPAACEDFAAALTTLLRPLADGPRCLVHRDFFAGNLIWLPDRTALRRVGILDFQGAALGHPAYDLVSLLQDARRDIPQSHADHAIARYLAARPDLDPDPFRTAYAICAAQRHLRVACQWVRLAVRDHRSHYLAHGPRTWHLLDAALRHPAAAPLAAAMDRRIPPAMRANPRGLAA